MKKKDYREIEDMYAQQYADDYPYGEPIYEDVNEHDCML